MGRKKTLFTKDDYGRILSVRISTPDFEFLEDTAERRRQPFPDFIRQFASEKVKELRDIEQSYKKD